MKCMRPGFTSVPGPLALAISLAVGSQYAHAQQAPGAQDAGAPASETAAPSGTTPQQLDTVVVTATKREKPLRDVPASITAIGGDELERRGVQNIDDLVKLVPGVNVTTPSNNAARITIRGIAGEANTNPTTGILFGDTAFTNSYVPHVTLDPNPFDLEGVEVLKGPQGTLFGASALNGAIRYKPMQPVLGELSGKYYLQSSNVSEGSSNYGVGGAVNLPFGEIAALRFVVFDHELPGWTDNTLAGRKDANQGHQTGARAILTFQPSDALGITLTYAGQKTARDDIAAADNFDGDLVARNRPSMSPSKQRYDLGALSISYDFEPFTLISETSHIDKRYRATTENTGSTVPVELVGNQTLVVDTGTMDSNSLSQEFRLVSNDSPDSPWSWVVGAFASREEIHQSGAYLLGDPAITIPVLNALGGVPFGTTCPGLTTDTGQLCLGNVWDAIGRPNYSDSDIDVTVREVALFFDVTRTFAEDWELSLGGRFYGTKSGGTVVNRGFVPTAQCMLMGQCMPDTLDDSVEENGFNPKVSLLWHASDNVNFYATVSKGYRVGGPQWGSAGLTGLAPTTFKTDTIWNYELGMRSHWLGHSLLLDATAFYEKWEDPQVLVFTTGLPAAYVDNVGGVTSKGIEAALRYLFPIEGLSLNLSAAYTDARTTEPFTTSDGSVVPEGTRWPLAPKLQTAATLGYDRHFGNWVAGSYISNAYISESTYGINQASGVFGYSLTDVQLSIANTAWKAQPELSLTVSNVTDKRGLSTAYAGSTSAGTPWYSGGYVQPRTIMLRLSGSF